MKTLRHRAIINSINRQEYEWHKAVKGMVRFTLAYTSQFMATFNVGAPMPFKHPITLESITVTIVKMTTRKNGSVDLTLRVKKNLGNGSSLWKRRVKINIPYYKGVK